MRWDDLFADLESQLEQEHGAEEPDLLAEEERLRPGRLALRDRLLAIAQPGQPAESLGVELRDGSRHSIAVDAVGRDWIAGRLESGMRRSCILPVAAIVSILPDAAQLERSLQPRTGREPAASLSARLGLTFVLRDLCRRRAPVDLQGVAGLLHGTIDRVGRDHLDLAAHEPGAARREESVACYLIARLAQIVLVRL